MGRAGVAVDAPVLAASIGVDGSRKGNVRGLVGGEDAPRRLDAHLGHERRGLLVETSPAIIEGLYGGRVEATRGVGDGAATLERLS